MKAAEIVDRKKVGNWEVGNFNGFHVAREKGDTRWRFNICGFSDSDCAVLMFDGATTRQRIDAKNNLYILGARFSPRHWTH